MLKTIVRAIIFCGGQCIALRGDSEQLDTPGNTGNFPALLKLLTGHSIPMRCVTYMSQNEVIEVIGKHVVLRRVVLKASDISADDPTMLSP